MAVAGPSPNVSLHDRTAVWVLTSARRLTAKITWWATSRVSYRRALSLEHSESSCCCFTTDAGTFRCRTIPGCHGPARACPIRSPHVSVFDVGPGALIVPGHGRGGCLDHGGQRGAAHIVARLAQETRHADPRVSASLCGFPGATPAGSMYKDGTFTHLTRSGHRRGGGKLPIRQQDSLQAAAEAKRLSDVAPTADPAEPVTDKGYRVTS